MAHGRDEILAVLQDAGGDSLRDAWLFDDGGHESLYLRPDVRDRVAELEGGSGSLVRIVSAPASSSRYTTSMIWPSRRPSSLYREPFMGADCEEVLILKR